MKGSKRRTTSPGRPSSPLPSAAACARSAFSKASRSASASARSWLMYAHVPPLARPVACVKSETRPEHELVVQTSGRALSQPTSSAHGASRPPLGLLSGDDDTSDARTNALRASKASPIDAPGGARKSDALVPRRAPSSACVVCLQGQRRAAVRALSVCERLADRVLRLHPWRRSRRSAAPSRGACPQCCRCAPPALARVEAGAERCLWLAALQRNATPALIARSVAAGVAFGTFPVPVLAPVVLVPLFARLARLSLPLVVAVQLAVGAGAPRPCASPCAATHTAAPLRSGAAEHGPLRARRRSGAHPLATAIHSAV